MNVPDSGTSEVKVIYRPFSGYSENLLFSNRFSSEATGPTETMFCMAPLWIKTSLTELLSEVYDDHHGASDSNN